MYSIKLEIIQNLGAAIIRTIPKSIRKFTVTGIFYNICKIVIYGTSEYVIRLLKNILYLATNVIDIN